MNSPSTQLSPFAMTLAHTFSSSFIPVFIAATILIFIGMGLRDPWPADEPRFALIAKEMVETGQWFFPTRAQEYYPDKPPIFMWSIALFYWISGSLRVAFLLPSALSGLLTLFLIYDIGKRLWNKKTGVVAAWLLLFSFQFLLQSKTAQIDAMVTAFITVGCYGLLRFCLADGSYRWYAVAWFFMGIGVITKGVGFLPLLMLIPYAFLCYRKQLQLVQFHWLPLVAGPFIMLFAIGLWFIPMLIIVAISDNAALELYRDNILFKQTLTRYADSWHHIKPAWYYISSVIPVFWLPLSFCIPWLIKPWGAAFKRLDGRIILPLTWIVLVIVFFSLSPGKRGVYIFPALPMLALCVAPFFPLLLKSTGLKNLLYGLSLLFAGIFTTVSVLGFFDIEAITKLIQKLDIEPWFLFFIVGISALIGIVLTQRFSRWLAWPVFFSALWLAYSTYGYHLRNDVSTPKNIYVKVQELIDVESQLGLIGFSEQFILFSPFPLVHFGYHTSIENQLSSAYNWHDAENKYLLIEDSEIFQACYDMTQALDLGFAHRRHWLLMPFSAKHASCAYSATKISIYKYTPPQ